MKRCSWCGNEYPDTAERCAIDAQPLEDGNGPVADGGAEAEVLTVEPPAVAPSAIELPALKATERQLRIFELVLVCAIALGDYIFYAMYHFPGVAPGNSVGRSRSWLYSCLHEVSGLALLWYVLVRRSRSVSDLGFSWTNKDVPRSAVVWLMGTAAFGGVYAILHVTGLTPSAHAGAGAARVGRLLFGGGITFMTIVFQFINPFFEELIVRAYLMTEIRQLTNSVAKAVLLSTLVQTSYHFYQGAALALAEGGIFLVFSIYYARTNRITPVILAHLYMDVWSTVAFMLGH